MQTSNIALTLGNITVRQHNGLFSLNDLHKASGGNPGQRPGEFIRNQQTQELIEEISNAGISAFESRKGNNGGTYACRELVIAYAAWISAAFHLKVIRVFLDAVQPQRPHNPAIDYDRISPSQAQDLKELVHRIAESRVQGFGETWARLHRKFRVNSYLELPATRFDEARDYLLGKLPEEAKALPDAERLSLAFSVAAEAGAQVQRSVFNQLVDGALPDMVHARTIAAVSFDRSGKPTIPWAQAMGAQEFIATADDLPRLLDCRDVTLTDLQAARIIGACARVLNERASQRIAA